MADSTLEFEGRSVPIEAGDTVASALFRADVRTFTRSFKYHRRRGLYCLTGDCPNCLLRVDGEPAVPACCTAARSGLRVEREGGWPSVERDALALNRRLGWLFPVGFYYKTLVRPNWVWPLAERIIRRLTGLGVIDTTKPPLAREQMHHHPDVLVVGAGAAGLAAAAEAAAAGQSVLICEEHTIGHQLSSPATRRYVLDLAESVISDQRVTLLERAAATGIYEGPLVPVNGEDALHLVHPKRIVVATGAVEGHPVLPGADLPGVWLGRGAALLAERHGIAVGRNVLAVGSGPELDEHVASLRRIGASVTTTPYDLVRTIRGRKSVTAALVGDAVLDCDAVVFSLPLEPRDGLLRQGGELDVVGAGDVVAPGCTVAEAERSGRDAVARRSEAISPRPKLACPSQGFVCLCEDVTMKDLQQAWREGFRSTELLKRYTTVAMGPCRGQLCQRLLTTFVAEQTGRLDAPMAQATTARAPTRGLKISDAAAGMRDEHEMLTTLHDAHVAAGATLELSGGWLRPSHYGDVESEYWAVRRSVSYMDVGTLGKFLIAGDDATAFLERLYPCRIADIKPGRMRYALLLGPTGFVVDDGIICSLGEDKYYVTFTSVGAPAAESVLRDWADIWSMDVHIVNLTAARGAINVAGPRARDVLSALAEKPDAVESLPYLHHLHASVAGIECHVIRLGFLGELSYELHHASSRSPELWNAIATTSQNHDGQPHGLEALRLLRLEKAHIIVGQDTDYDTTPAKLGMNWAVALDKPEFVGRTGVLRSKQFPTNRELFSVSFSARHAPPEGSALTCDGRHVGHLTSSRFSPVLQYGVALGWVDRVGEDFPSTVTAGGLLGTVAKGPFYDAKGDRLRG